MVRAAMSRWGCFIALPLLLTQTACISVTVTTVVGDDGSVVRVVKLHGGPYREALANLERRFAAPWVVSRDEASAELTARLSLAPGADLPKNESLLRVRWREWFLFTDYRFDEDWLKVRLGHSLPAIAPIPPSILLVAPVLAHEKNLAVIERRTRESIKVSLTVTMPGHVRGGNFQRREGDALSWDFNFRMPARPHAESRIYHPIPIALLCLALFGAVGLALARFAIDSRQT